MPFFPVIPVRDTGIYLIFIMDIICSKNLLSISLFPVIPVSRTGMTGKRATGMTPFKCPKSQCLYSYMSSTGMISNSLGEL
ncbi:hypothetical protein [Wolbachia endosymbiont (group A) of Ennomos erosarius]|uniref:hypothetical protein n=1 Tax=Wolbachia endosymbiont (group A) of Ennomos erosarius TaxID=3066174 RepID=UPI00333E2DC1